MTMQVGDPGAHAGAIAVAVAGLERAFDGQLVRPGAAAYDVLRRVWNGSIDRHPAVIARCASVADVIAAVRVGRETDVPIAVRGGGHSFPGLSVCDDGVVIDLGVMKDIRVDASAGRVHAQAGVLLGELDRATQACGQAVPLGSVSHTGIAGLTLGGGFGWLMRRLGLTIDQVVAMNVVTADGEVLRASETDDPDLFWGLRGGGGNFGIVTDFEYRLQPVGPTVLSGLLLWPQEDGVEVVRFYRDWAREAPDELTTALVLRRAPALDIIPSDLHGRPVVGVASCWSGELDRGEAVLEPMRRFGSHGVDLVSRRPYLEHQAFLDPSFPPGIWIHSKAADVNALTDAVVDVLLTHAARIGSDRSGIIAWQLGGAVARVGELETPFGSRQSGYLVDIVGATDGPSGFERERTWARDTWASLGPHRAGVYMNWLMDEGQERVREAYGAERYARLQVVKRRYDPENVFRLNQNVLPA